MVQRQGWATQIVSQGGWHSGPSKQKDLCDSAAYQWGQTREFLTSPIICNEGGRREVSTSCLREVKTWRVYLSTWCEEICIL